VEPFEKKFPDRFYNTGIAEQNLILTAAGMAVAGMRPVAYSMSCFLPSRAFEQIKISVCYQDLPVTIVGIGSGMSYGEMGPTHHAAEESAIMRSLPNLTVVFPADSGELSETLRYAINSEHPTYIGFPKAPSPQLPAHVFDVEKAACYREGKDGAILSVGASVSDSLNAAEMLAQNGMELSVYGLHTVKPLDREAILAACDTGSVFIVDEHQSWASTAGDVASLILEAGKPLRHFRSLSIPNRFTEKVFRHAELLGEFGLDAEGIADNIKNARERDG
jgi:transketolase